MSTLQRILLFFVLPILAPLLYSPDWLMPLVFTDGAVSAGGVVGILMFVALFAFLGYLLLTGSSTALTLVIFLQGLNAIARLMMMFPRLTYLDGTPNFFFAIMSILSIGLSTYLVLRLDQVDVRKTMVK